MILAAPAQGVAEHRLYRLMSVSLAIAAIVGVCGSIPAMIAQAPLLSVPYTIGAVLMIGTPAVVVLLRCARAPIADLRRIWGVQALAMLVAYLMIPPILGGRRLPEAFGLSWPVELEIISACAAVLAWNLRPLLNYVVLWQAALFAIALFWCDNPVFGRALGDTVRHLFFNAMFMCLAVALLRAGRILDAELDAAVREAGATAAAEAVRTARSRVQMLVHDRICVALLAYAGGVPRSQFVAAAEEALAEIRRGAGELAVDATPQRLAWRLQELTTRLDPGVRFDYTAGGEAEVPAEVGVALGEALSEALRNSVRHAPVDRPTARQVHAELGSDHIEVVVLDDGDGFDPATVDATRLGVRQGILQRMREVPGGGAQVRSTPGYGTTVSLWWDRR